MAMVAVVLNPSSFSFLGLLAVELSCAVMGAAGAAVEFCNGEGLDVDVGIRRAVWAEKAAAGLVVTAAGSSGSPQSKL